MSFSYYKLLWLLAHALVTVFEAVFHFGLEFRENFRNFIKKISQSRYSHTSTSDRQLIESRLNELNKIPKHMGVILSVSSEKDVDIQKLTRLVTWALSSGINFISFYDYKGIVKHKLSSSFHDAVEQHAVKTDGDNIVWGPDFQSPSIDGTRYPHRNGFKRHIVVNLLSIEDGQEQFTKLMQLKGSDQLQSKQITIDHIDEMLGRLNGNLPDPDLAVFFGNTCCTMGFLPWQIRLTEFIPISHKLKSLTLDKYIDVLYKYAKCQQRFGK